MSSVAYVPPQNPEAEMSRQAPSSPISRRHVYPNDSWTGSTQIRNESFHNRNGY